MNWERSRSFNRTALNAAEVDMRPATITASRSIQTVFWMATPFHCNKVNQATHCKMDRLTEETILAPTSPLIVIGADISVCSVLFSTSSVIESTVILPETKAGKNISKGMSTE